MHFPSLEGIGISQNQAITKYQGTQATESIGESHVNGTRVEGVLTG
jgi:hypothetical protein